MVRDRLTRKYGIADSWNIINLNSFMINNNYNIIHSYFYSYYFNASFHVQGF